MPKLFPVVVRRFSGGGPPTVLPAVLRIAMATKHRLLDQMLAEATASEAKPESVPLTDTRVSTATGTATKTSQPRLTDARVSTVGSASAPKVETIFLRPDRGIALISALNIGRSGTPDNDRMGDAWTDGLAANQGVNHGNENLDIVNLVTGAHRGWMKWDFGAFFGTVAADSMVAQGTHVLSFRAQAALGTSNPVLTFSLMGQAGNPFTESTINHTNAPNPAFTITKTVTITGTALATYTITLTDSEVNDIRNGWVLARITSGDAANAVTIVSRDSATAADRPVWQLQMVRN